MSVMALAQQVADEMGIPLSAAIQYLQSAAPAIKSAANAGSAFVPGPTDVDALQGMASATLGGVGDMEYLFRMAQEGSRGAPLPVMMNQQTVAPTTDEVGRAIGANVEDPLFQASSFFGFDPFGPLGKVAGVVTAAAPLAVRAGAKVARSAGEKIAETSSDVGRMLGGEPPRIDTSYVRPSEFKTQGKNPPTKPLEGRSSKAHLNTFAQRLSEARQAMPENLRAQVDMFDPTGFEGRAFLTDDGLAGFTVDKNGYIANLFKHPGAPKRGVLESAMTKARAEGAKTLDAFDTFLVKNYLKTGAEETGRFPWNPEYATPEIIRGLGDKRPDYVSMKVGGQIKEQKFPTLIDPREQAALPRYRTTPTGRDVAEPSWIPELFRPENVDRLVETFKSGRQRGGDRWYWLGGLLDEFIKEMGPATGLQRFERFMDLGASVSPKSNVMQEIKRASVLYKRELEGLPITPLAADMFPPGYGHLATSTAHAPGVERLVNEGVVGDPAVGQMKVSSYAENKKGNYQPMTIDGHNFSILTYDPETGRMMNRSPSKTEYPFLESRQGDVARMLGVDPAEFQSGLWVGADNITGVHNSQNYTEAMNMSIARVAEDLDIPEAEAKIRFLNGDTVLRALVPVGVGGVIAGGVMERKKDRLQ